MLPALKRYYLMHLSYWIQQLVVLALRIEKPRKDFKELVAHHIVTLWLIGYAGHHTVVMPLLNALSSWSYGVNMTLIGNAVFVSMDIPDVFLGVRLSLVSVFARLTVFAALKIVQLSWFGKIKNILLCDVICHLDVSISYLLLV